MIIQSSVDSSVLMGGVGEEGNATAAPTRPVERTILPPWRSRMRHLWPNAQSWIVSVLKVAVVGVGLSPGTDPPPRLPAAQKCQVTLDAPISPRCCQPTRALTTLWHAVVAALPP